MSKRVDWATFVVAVLVASHAFATGRWLFGAALVLLTLALAHLLITARPHERTRETAKNRRQK